MVFSQANAVENTVSRMVAFLSWHQLVKNHLCVTSVQLHVQKRMKPDIAPDILCKRFGWNIEAWAKMTNILLTGLSSACSFTNCDKGDNIYILMYLIRHTIRINMV